jgi:sec-independent protein translocase protein TatA
VVELFSPGHLIPLLLIAALLFFGWKQLPDMAKSAGKSLRAFRTEVKGMSDDDAVRDTKSALTAAHTPDSSVAVPVAEVVAPAVPVVVATPVPVVAPVDESVAPDATGKPAG